MLTLTLDSAALTRQIDLVRQVARLPRLKPGDRAAFLDLLRLLGQLRHAVDGLPGERLIPPALAAAECGSQARGADPISMR